jgi:hypothetical protein
VWTPTANGADKIAIMARSVFERAGGTDKGLPQSKFRASQTKIVDALDRLAADGILGGEPPPQPVIKRDLSKKDSISRTDFLQYFRGLASERDLELRRKQAELAAGQANAAADAARRQAQAREAAARAAEAEAQAQEAIDRPNQTASDPDLDAINRQLEYQNQLLEQQLLKERWAELEWYRLHPNQLYPDRKSQGASTNSPPAWQGVAIVGPQANQGGKSVPPLTTNGPGGQRFGTPGPQQNSAQGTRVGGGANGAVGSASSSSQADGHDKNSDKDKSKK